MRAPHTLYELVIVGGNLLLPWHYGTHRCAIDDTRSVRRLTGLTRDLLGRFGSEPGWRALTLHELDGNAEDSNGREEVAASARSWTGSGRPRARLPVTGPRGARGLERPHPGR